MTRLARASVLTVLASAAGAAQADPWTHLRILDGKWEGTASGEPGNGVATREYRFELGGRFLAARNKSVYEPKSPDAKGEVHEDYGLFSYDRAQKKVVLRQFHSEGFVNEYLMSAESADGKTFEFTTTRIENIPPGWRAREAYQVISPDEVVETFSLAAPGKDFTVYSQTRLKRVKR